MKKVSIRQPILDAIENTDPEMGRNIPLLLKWAKKCEVSIGSALGYKHIAKTYTVDGGEIVLPDNCLTVKQVLYGNHEDTVNVFYRDYNSTLMQSDARDDDTSNLDWYWQPVDTIIVQPAIWEQYGDVLNLIGNFINQDITIQYTYLEKDDRGYFLVNESHVDAITKFVIYMWAKKYNWKIYKSGKLYRNTHIEMINSLQRDYQIAIRNARALDGAESEFERKQY